MQAELLRDIQPPSYEESVYLKQLVGQIKVERRKTPPPSYDNNGIFEMFKEAQLLNNKTFNLSIIDEPITTPSTKESHDNENQQDSPMDERLERISSCLQQMIDAANQSLISSSVVHPSPKNSDTTDNIEENDKILLGGVLNEQMKKQQQWQINRKTSLERLKSSQDSLARTIDKLNSSITQHIIDKEASPIYQYTQHNHHHHHHYYYQQSNSNQRQHSTSRKSMVSLWTKVLTHAAMVYGICHQLLSWSTSTSSIISIAWLVTMLLAKKKFNNRKLGLVTSSSSSSPAPTTAITSFYPQLKSFLMPCYLSLQSRFRKQ